MLTANNESVQGLSWLTVNPFDTKSKSSGAFAHGTKAALEDAEKAVSDEQNAIQQPAMMMPDVRGRLRRIADTLADRSRQVPAAREALRALIGEAILRNENGNPFAEIAGSHLAMVAGAGFGSYLTAGPVRIALTGRGS